MARIAPACYPERIAFEAHARKLQGQEMDRLCAATLRWMRSAGGKAMRRVRLALTHRARHTGAPLST